ncbi:MULTISPECIES: amino acid ABC transporter permease [unclassified Rhizobium]|uniref:amino acid ABC transporter permease n=1 Tax=unclassified Rhizobium TaxID=2613769 RepID=UPI001ADD4D75|nr:MULTISPECIES: amino acid ABC transporter permease [unclassified Rhizobium]MBO9127206.1 amino acid ABC transporter permease [Rhizobium sp. 16-488-2b]MBO9177649.1 amino acid ABC transporter permease [Rhizobium sp. 16-488-2a]
MRTFGSPEFLFIVYALRWTLTLTVIAFIGGGIAGIALALLRISSSRALKILTSAYMQFIQGLPLLVLMFICYYAPSLLGYEVSAIVAAAVALTINSSAFLGAIWESALRAIPKAQWESADALAITPLKTLRYVIAPQAIKLAMPSTVGFLVQIIKQTSIASIIGFIEITRAGQLVSNATFEPLKSFLAVAALYFAVCFPLTQVSLWLERRGARRGSRA